MDIENQKKRQGAVDTSFPNRIQEMEERISGAEDSIEIIDSTVKDNVKRKKLLVLPGSCRCREPLGSTPRANLSLGTTGKTNFSAARKLPVPPSLDYLALEAPHSLVGFFQSQMRHFGYLLLCVLEWESVLCSIIFFTLRICRKRYLQNIMDAHFLY